MRCDAVSRWCILGSQVPLFHFHLTHPRTPDGSSRASMGRSTSSRQRQRRHASASERPSWPSDLMATLQIRRFRGSAAVTWWEVGGTSKNIDSHRPSFCTFRTKGAVQCSAVRLPPRPRSTQYTVCAYRVGPRPSRHTPVSASRPSSKSLEAEECEPGFLVGHPPRTIINKYEPSFMLSD